MPVYEYRCDRCGRVYEEWIGHGEQRPGGCPQCGHESRVRVPSRFAIAVSQDTGSGGGSGPARGCPRGGSCDCAP